MVAVMASVTLPRNVLPLYCRTLATFLPGSLSTKRIYGRYLLDFGKFHTGCPHKGPLTLASLGFQNEANQIKKVKTKKSKVTEVFKIDVKDTSSKETEVFKIDVKDTFSKETEVFKIDVKDTSPSKRSNLKNKSKTVTSKTQDDNHQNTTDTETFPFAGKSFSAFNLPRPLLKRLEEEGLEVPTDVQVTAIPNILKGQDVAIQSYTGSGKTLAYLIPILSKVGPLKEIEANNTEGDGKPGVEAVIVAPSRELAMQIVREAEKILGSPHKRVVQQLVGGANRSRQEEALKKNKPLIVVGTPGRISEISLAGKLHTHGCRFLVLDEVDELLSFNFRENMHRILEHVGRRRFVEEQGIQDKDSEITDPMASRGTMSSLTGKNERIQRQTILVSATMPTAVLRAATSWGHKPLLVRANSVIDVESAHKTGAPVSGTSGATIQGTIDILPPSLEHFYVISQQQHKVDTLRRCVHALDAKSIMVFMNHNKQLKDTVFKLEARGLSACSLHGDLSKLERTNRLVSFRKGEFKILVTNELAARGLDVMTCDLVVNIDLPTDSIHYTHRAGRTGRLGQKGTVLTICEQSEEFVIKKFQRQLGIFINCCDFARGHLNICKKVNQKTESKEVLHTSSHENC